MVEDELQVGGLADTVALEPVFYFVGRLGNGAETVEVQQGDESLEDIVVAESKVGSGFYVQDGIVGLVHDVFQQGNHRIALGDVVQI